MRADITHIGLAVPDLEKAIEWYGKVFGFHVLAGPFDFNEEKEPAPNMTQDLQGTEVKKMRNVHLMSPGGVGIELFEFREPAFEQEKPAAHKGFFHLCLIVDDIVEAIEQVVLYGGRQRSKIWNINEGKHHYLVYTEDPFGNIIELYNRSTSEIYGNR